MKTLTVSKADYDEILYPLVALKASEDDATLRLAFRVLDKLEDVGEPHENPGGPSMYRLSDLSATFELEEDEAKFVATRLRAGIPQLATTRARAIVPMLDALEAA